MKPPKNNPEPRGWQGTNDSFEMKSKQEGHIVGRVGQTAPEDLDEMERYGGS